MPTPLNDQITDAVTQTNVKVLGDNPAVEMGTLYQSAAHSTGIVYDNNTVDPQQVPGQAAAEPDHQA